MKTIRNIVIATAVIVAGLMAIMLTSCDDNKDDNDYGRMTVKMTDAPAEFTSINVEIDAIMVRHSNRSVGNDGWVSLETKSGVYNLLGLQNGVTVDIANQQMQKGNIEMIRVMIGNENTIVLDDAHAAIALDPAFAAGVDIALDRAIEAGNEMVVTIDFDAKKSITEFDGTRFILSPYITVQSVVFTD